MVPEPGFIEPDDNPEKDTYFPKLPPASASFLDWLLAEEYRDFDRDGLDSESEARQFRLAAALDDFLQLDEEVFRFVLLFSPDRLAEYLDETKRKAAAAAFDWSAFLLAEERRSRLFCLHLVLLLPLLQSNDRFAEAWMALPVADRSVAYRAEPFLSNPQLASRLEGLPSTLTIPPEAWERFAADPSSFRAYASIISGQLPEEGLGGIPRYAAGETLHRPFVRAVGQGTRAILGWIYASASPADALSDIDAALEADDLLLSPEAQAASWAFLKETLQVAGPAETAEFILRFLRGAGGERPGYPGPDEPGAIDAAATWIVDLLFRPEVLDAFRRGLAEWADGWTRRTTFDEALLAAVDRRLAKHPSADAAFLYALWFILEEAGGRSVGEDPPPSLDPMVLASLMKPGELRRIVELGEFYRWNREVEVEWRAVVLRKAAMAGAVASSALANPRFRFCAASTAQAGFEYIPLPVFGNPVLGGLVGLIGVEALAPEVGTLGYPDPARFDLISIALATHEELITAALREALVKKKRLHPFLVALYVAALSEDSEVDDDSVLDILESQALLASLSCDVLGYLIRDKARLIERLFALWYPRMLEDPGHACDDFWTSTISLVFKTREGLNRELDEGVYAFLVGRVLSVLAQGEGAGNRSEITVGLMLGRRLLSVAPAATDERLVGACARVAQGLFAELRKAARAGQDGAEAELLLSVVEAAAVCIRKAKGPWPAVKQLLVLFRQVQHPSIGSDLDPFSPELAEPWAAVPRAIHGLLDRPWGPDEGREIRRSMTHDLLDFLKPRKEGPRPEAGLEEGRRHPGSYDPRLTEPDETWRYAYIRAVGDLGADPSDSRHFHHQVLDKVASNDPSARVREAAAKASAALRSRSGWKPGSTKRLLLNAWWWIRQAHLLEAGAPIDEDRALRRRDSEVRV